MTRRAVALYMSITCALSIIMPGRFYIGVILSVEMLLLTVTIAFLTHLLNYIKLTLIKECILCIYVIFFTILFKSLLSLAMPLIALQLSFLIYFPSISSFTTAFLITDSNKTLMASLIDNLTSSLVFCVYILLFSLFRDLFGYGTITFPAIPSFIQLRVIADNTGISSLIASVPAACILSGVLLIIFLMIERKYNIIKLATRK